MGWVYRVEGERTMGALACAFSWDTLPSTVLAATGTRAMQAIVESSCWGWGGGGGECGGVSSANFRVSYPKLPGGTVLGRAAAHRHHGVREHGQRHAVVHVRAVPQWRIRPTRGALSPRPRCGGCGGMHGTQPNPRWCDDGGAPRVTVSGHTCRRAELQAPCPAIPPARS